MMLRRISAAILAAALGGCAHIPTPIVDIAKCEQTRAQWAPFLMDLQADLVASNWSDLVESLAARLTWPLVQCALNEILHKPGLRHDDVVRIRAQYLLAVHGG